MQLTLRDTPAQQCTSTAPRAVVRAWWMKSDACVDEGCGFQGWASVSVAGLGLGLVGFAGLGLGGCRVSVTDQVRRLQWWRLRVYCLRGR
jgi:hypothetical protein